MKLTQYVLDITNLNDTFISVILCTIGFFMYILTSKVLNYIPQELYNFISLKFKKAI